MLFQNDVKTIEKLAQKGKESKIIPFLESKKQETRIAAAKAFKNVDKPEIYNNLITMLHNSAAEERLAAAEALSLSKQAAALTHLSHRMDLEKDEKVSQAIHNAIVCIREHMEKHE